jgi:hypothetical protein
LTRRCNATIFCDVLHLGERITGATEMPIRRYVEEGVFTPQSLSAMSTALEAAMEILGLGGDEAKRGAVAKFIIRLACEDGILDATELRDKAVAAVGRCRIPRDCSGPSVPKGLPKR